MTDDPSADGENAGVDVFVEKIGETDADVAVETEVIEGDDVVETLVERTDEHDVTAMGAESEGVLRKLVFGTVPESVGDRTRSTAIVARGHLPPSSQLTRLLG
jgi:nucleotide-binding universal stress UspA family protein